MDKCYVQFIYDLYHFIYNSVIGIFLLMIDIILCIYILDSCCNKLLSWNHLGIIVLRFAQRECERYRGMSLSPL